MTHEANGRGQVPVEVLVEVPVEVPVDMLQDVDKSSSERPLLRVSVCSVV